MNRHVMRAVSFLYLDDPAAHGYCHSRRHFRSGLKLFFAAAMVWTSSAAKAADGYVPFVGDKIDWHG
jgi:hypothetical protein